MYKSPIDLSFTDMICKNLVDEGERTIFRAVQNVGVNVDKEELVRALKYDREQYESGYEDGADDVLDLLSSAWYGKDAYFRQEDGLVYSRISGKYMTFDKALQEFAEKIGDDGSA